MSDTTPTMRERLARAACCQDGCTCGGPENCKSWDIYEGEVDAILQEMQRIGREKMKGEIDQTVVREWADTICIAQHIIDEGKSVRIPIEGTCNKQDVKA